MRLLTNELSFKFAQNCYFMKTIIIPLNVRLHIVYIISYYAYTGLICTY